MTRTPNGALPPPREFGPVTQTDIVRFAGAGGDFNPLHHDPETAERAGFPRPIAMGQMTAGLTAAWVTDWCGVENLRELRVRFVSPVGIGDTLQLTATPSDQQPEGPDVRLALLVSVGARTVLTGSAVVRPG